MPKVLRERPRGGQYRAKGFPRREREFDNLPKAQGIGRAHRQRKWPDENLGPLRRWLRSNVGRKWNDVYSEACSVINLSSTVHAHFRARLLDSVERHTFIRNGEVYCGQFWPPIPMASWRGHPVWPKFFVHPETGVLCEVPHKKAFSSAEELERRINDTRRWVTDRLLLLKIDGLWFACEMKPFGKRPERPPFDLIFKLRLAASHARDAYGRVVYCEHKRQLSRKELNHYRLRNSRKGDGIHALLGEDLLLRMKRSHGNPIRGGLENGVTILKPVSCRAVPCEEPFFDGFQNGVSVHDDVAADSSPVPRTKCWRSSGVGCVSVSLVTYILREPGFAQPLHRDSPNEKKAPVLFLTQ